MNINNLSNKINKMPETNYIHGLKVTFEEDCRDCSHYLEDRLDNDESRVFFEYARLHGKANFRDNNNKKFTLNYKNGAYTLEKR